MFLGQDLLTGIVRNMSVVRHKIHELGKENIRLFILLNIMLVYLHVNVYLLSVLFSSRECILWNRNKLTIKLCSCCKAYNERTVCV